MKKTLEEQDGYLFVVVEQSLQDEPIMMRRWYPTGAKANEHNRQFVGEPVRRLETAPTSGWYELNQVAQLGNYPPRPRFRLLNLGDTLPQHTDEVPIPPPKTRCEVRYRDGCWWKLLKAKGWVQAGP